MKFATPTIGWSGGWWSWTRVQSCYNWPIATLSLCGNWQCETTTQPSCVSTRHGGRCSAQTRSDMGHVFHSCNVQLKGTAYTRSCSTPVTSYKLTCSSFLHNTNLVCQRLSYWIMSSLIWHSVKALTMQSHSHPLQRAAQTRSVNCNYLSGRLPLLEISYNKHEHSLVTVSPTTRQQI